MEPKKFSMGIKLLSIFFLFLFIHAQEEATFKVKVIVDNANVKATPEISGRTVAKLPLNTILDAEKKQGEWYKVYIEKEGVQISGFIHEMLVEITSEDRAAQQVVGIQSRSERTQPEIVAEIEIKMDGNRKLIRQEKDYEEAINSLRPLIAKVFNVSDQKKQKELAASIFYWIALAYAGQGNDYSALREIRSMFEVDYAYAKEITRNIYDPKIVVLIQQAEKEFLGLITEYSIEISTEPKEARIIINGREIGFSPEIYRSSTPKITIEIEKAGYKPIQEEIFLTQVASNKNYILESLGRNVGISSNPPGASVFLDGNDTGKVTDCLLPFVPLGVHNIKIIKENYAEWEGEVEIVQGEAPFPVEVILTVKNYVYLRKWGGLNQKLFQQPTGIALDKEENFYVIDKSSAKLKKFSSTGRLLSNWEKQGRDFKKLKNPAGIAVDSQGFIYVTDMKNNCVMKFDKKGNYIKKWGKEGIGSQDFKTPRGIAIDSNNNVYVADSANNRIKKYSPLGALTKTWGKQGTSDGDFVFPTAVVVNQKNEILVLDKVRVQKFSLEGNFIASWGKRGAGDKEFNNPAGICIDQNNYIYVADSGNNRIQKFDENGKFISKWGSRGTANGQMSYPAGIAVNSKGDVIIVERGNNRVQLFGIPTQSES